MTGHTGKAKKQKPEVLYGAIDSCFEIPDEEWDDDGLMDMAMLTLHQIGLKIGDRIRMDYDFGTTQTFWLELIAAEDMKRGRGRQGFYGENK